MDHRGESGTGGGDGGRAPVPGPGAKEGVVAKTRQRLSEDRRAQILEAAVEVICDRGLCDTRIADIAERAGTSSALILYYFESKDRLLAEALAFSEERFYTETAQQLDGIEDARDQ